MKHRCFCEYKQHCSNTTLITYVVVQNKCKNIVKQAKEKHERSIGLACENNLTLSRRYVQRKLKTPTGISSVLDGSTLVSSEKDRGNLLNRYFSKIYTKESLDNFHVAYEAAHSNGSTLSDVVITLMAVEERHGMLSCHRSHGESFTYFNICV